jgi:glutamate 5-kinase
MNINSFKRIAIKVGSNVLADNKGLLNQPLIGHLVEQMIEVRKRGIEVVLISSGAVAAGRSMVRIPEKFDTISARQALSSVGQVKLMNTWASFFERQDYICSQVLVTKEDFRDRVHYLNMKNCFHALLQNRIIPIVNENDAVSITELMFTDNDELAGLIASMINADALFILTNVDGVYKGDPSVAGSELITTIKADDIDFTEFVSLKKSNFGRGGMITKCNIARKVSQSGIHVFIANGAKENMLLALLNGEELGTHFLPLRITSTLKKWIAHSEGFAKGSIYINEGAKAALLSAKATSVLPVGVVKIDGQFKKGEIVKIFDEGGSYIGLGKAEYGFEKALERQGHKNQKPLVHYDYLYLV